MAKLPTFSSQAFTWKDRKGTSCTAKLNIRIFPPGGFYIKSHRTGDLMLFLYDGETMEANEFFDGEAAAYFNPGGDVRVQIWVGDNI